MADDSFESLMRAGVVPLRSARRAAETPAGGKAASGRTAGILPPAAASDADGGWDEHGQFSRSGFSPKDIKKLRGCEVDATLDLHGMTLSQAHEEIELFLANALRRGFRTVEIVHGRGVHSAGGAGVLRGPVRRWMANCGAVLAYVEPSKNGGAILVRLKKR